MPLQPQLQKVLMRLIQSMSRRFAFIKLLGAIGIYSFNKTLAFAASDFYIPSYLINFFIDQHSPIVKEWLIFKLTLNNLNLLCIPESQRLQLNGIIQISSVNNLKLTGQFRCSSSFIYDLINYQFLLNDPFIDNLVFDQLNDQNNALLLQSNTLLIKLLDQYPIYQLREEDLKLFTLPPTQFLVEKNGLRVYFRK